MASTWVYKVSYFVQDERFIAGHVYSDNVVISSAYGNQFEDIRDMIAIKKGTAPAAILVMKLEMIGE